MVRITYLVPKKIVLSSPMRGLRRWQDKVRTRRAAEQLVQIAGRATFLSDESVFNSRLEELAGLLKTLRP
jgi:hypothetical protein